MNLNNGKNQLGSFMLQYMLDNTISSRLALSGGGRIFSLHVHALIFPAFVCCLASSHLLTALQTWKIMDLINWSLNAIDTIFSTRSLGSGEPV
ncbi:MAG: hypothetical protein ACRC7H_08400, partial [Plesiomonas shigelloides]